MGRPEEIKKALEELDGKKADVEVVKRVLYTEDRPASVPTESFQEIVERAIREASMYGL